VIIRAKDTEDAVRIANDNEAGLSASVWTRDYKEALDVARSIESGAVRVGMAIGAHELTGRSSRCTSTARQCTMSPTCLTVV
jgi:acyl-CoA reductase-like NAD-dependent aldehyde dehydrogenase